MLKKLTLAALAALVASAYVSVTAAPEVTSRDDVFVAKFTCATGKPRKGSVMAPSKVATITKVGDAKITAAHVLEGCLKAPEAVFFEDLDLAIINPAKINSCRSALIGEPLTFHGYPGTMRDRKTLRNSVVLETQEGFVISLDSGTFLALNARGTLDALSGHVRAATSTMRGGYSGGAVLSAVNGDFLGIISTSAAEGAQASFIPASTICEKMEQLL